MKEYLNKEKERQNQLNQKEKMPKPLEMQYICQEEFLRRFFYFEELYKCQLGVVFDRFPMFQKAQIFPKNSTDISMLLISNQEQKSGENIEIDTKEREEKMYRLIYGIINVRNEETTNAKKKNRIEINEEIHMEIEEIAFIPGYLIFNTKAEIQILCKIKGKKIPLTIQVFTARKGICKGKSCELESIQYPQKTYEVRVMEPEVYVGILFYRWMMECDRGGLSMKEGFDLYFIGSRFALNGRKIVAAFQKVRDILQLQSKAIVNGESYEKLLLCMDKKGMDKKWKQYGKQIMGKDYSVEYEEMVFLIKEMLMKVWDSYEKDEDFFGEWMPEIKKYIG